MARIRDDADFEETPGEHLPWLEPAELEYTETGGGFLNGRTILIAALVIIAAVALLWWLAEYLGGGDIEIPEGGTIPLVEAPTGPYRIPPDEAGGREFDLAEASVHARALGESRPGEVDLSKQPETPVPVVGPAGTGRADGPPRNLMPGEAAPDDAEEGQAKAASEEANTRAPAAAKPEADPAPAPAPAAGGNAAVQLGAFSTRSKANEVWDTISERYDYIGALSKSVESVEAGGKTLYRLRATGAGSRAAANDLCARLKLAGESCVVP
ncbi:SPOR domain-containing protein [Pacificimonas sp. ICDLI1SI03]